jgi:hypothetical protein
MSPEWVEYLRLHAPELAKQMEEQISDTSQKRANCEGTLLHLSMILSSIKQRIYEDRDDMTDPAYTVQAILDILQGPID